LRERLEAEEPFEEQLSFVLLPSAFSLLPSACSVWLRAGYDFKAGFDHSVIAAQNCRCVIDTFSFKIDHRTGGRMFGRSRAIRDNHLVTWQLIDVRQDVGRRYQPRAFDVPSLVCRFATHIDNDHVIPGHLFL